MEPNEMMTGKTTRTVDSVASNAHKAIDRVSEAARPAVEQVAAGAHHALDKVAGAANQAAETISLKGKQLKDAQLRLADNCRGQLQERPLATLGVALAAGFMLNWLIRQRPSSTRYPTE
jgi:ElaB/YqjD/DUF883 family membrane-anchored ribosome-binding protein